MTPIYRARYRLVEWGRWERTGRTQPNPLVEQTAAIVATLSDEQRTLAVLSFAKGLSHGGIAQEIGVSRTTIAKQIEAITGYVAGKLYPA